ncbi:MAG: hypothetical protein GY937_06960 [bacterium]|nr:hypothetical protein [bacterium]
MVTVRAGVTELFLSLEEAPAQIVRAREAGPSRVLLDGGTRMDYDSR